MNIAALDNCQLATAPFPHALVASLFDDVSSSKVLDWLETAAPWRLKVAEFYEQFEFDALSEEVPSDIVELLHLDNTERLRNAFEQIFATNLTSRCSVTIHKLIRGQRIRIHNDHIAGAESHRLLVQLNRGWNEEMGGLLLLFASENSRDLLKAFRPENGSGVCFEISERSHHAVSPVVNGERYTVVYSFTKAQP